MTKEISNVLKNGKIGEFYSNKSKVDIKNDKYQITLIREVTYDEEDNFKDKIWILTSFDYTKSIEDKIRKATSSEVALKDLDSVIPQNQPKNGQEHGEVINRYSLGKDLCSFSEYKDMLKKSFEQQFGPEYFEKAKKGASIGTIKEFGGKKYINDSLIFCCPYQ